MTTEVYWRLWHIQLIPITFILGWFSRVYLEYTLWRLYFSGDYLDSLVELKRKWMKKGKKKVRKEWREERRKTEKKVKEPRNKEFWSWSNETLEFSPALFLTIVGGLGTSSLFTGPHCPDLQTLGLDRPFLRSLPVLIIYEVPKNCN